MVSIALSEGSYGEVNNVADSECQSYLYDSVVENKSQPQYGYYPESKTNSNTGPRKQPSKEACTSINLRCRTKRAGIHTLQVTLGKGI